MMWEGVRATRPSQTSVPAKPATKEGFVLDREGFMVASSLGVEAVVRKDVDEGCSRYKPGCSFLSNSRTLGMQASGGELQQVRFDEVVPQPGKWAIYTDGCAES